MRVTENAYRDRVQGLRLRYDALAERLDGLLDLVDTSTAAIYRRRIARSAAGLAALVGVIVMAATTALHFFVFGDRGALSGAPTAALLISWVMALCAYLAASTIAPALLRRRVADAVRPTGDVEIDLARLENAVPGSAARAIADSAEKLSVALPLAALAMLAPLTLHWIVYEVAIRGPSDSAAVYDRWIGMSLVIVGHCHVVLAILGWKFASRLRDEADGLQPVRASRAPGREGWAALGWVTLVSLVPGILLVFVPPVLVGVTGLAFVPLAFWAMGHRVMRERDALA